MSMCVSLVEMVTLIKSVISSAYNNKNKDLVSSWEFYITSATQDHSLQRESLSQLLNAWLKRKSPKHLQSKANSQFYSTTRSIASTQRCQMPVVQPDLSETRIPDMGHSLCHNTYIYVCVVVCVTRSQLVLNLFHYT